LNGTGKVEKKGIIHVLSGRKKLVLFSLLLIMLLFLLVLKAGYYLVADDGQQFSDAAVVLLGNIPDRALEAADLYHGGDVPVILIGQSYTEGYEHLTSRGVFIPDQAALMKEALSALGVVADDIVIIPGQAKSTLEEAVIIADYISMRTDIRSITLVTSSYHTRRTRLSFQHVFTTIGIDVEIYARPSRYDSFQASHWWRDRQSAKRIAQEYQKLVYFLFWERLRSL